MSVNRRPWDDNWDDNGADNGADESWEDAHAAWLEKWVPPCPLGYPQQLLTLLGFRQKSVDCLQLRVVLGWRDGICAAIVEEHPDLVYVRVLACHPEDEADDPRDPDRSREDLDSPCRAYLDAPLGERIVIDVDSGEPLPMFIPRWGTGEPSLYVPRPAGSLWPPDATNDSAG